MSNPAFYLLFLPLLSIVLAVAAFFGYVIFRYAPIVGRIFEEKPIFLPLRLKLGTDGETVKISTEDGFDLFGSYFKTRTTTRVGVIVFCHEFLSDRSSYKPYLDDLRNHGYDLFTFDFRNHGVSDRSPQYSPLQWVTDHEVADLNAALAYLRSREDRDPAGYGLFGISRGGGTALIVGASDPSVWGVITDGAFPTNGTMLAYIKRWAQIYVANNLYWRLMPTTVFQVLAWAGRLRSEKRLNCRFPSVEQAVRRLGPRPWFMIHGEKDAYIAPAIARELFMIAQTPKDIWIVPKAKHNRCRQVAPESYAERVLDFLRCYAPRTELAVDTQPVVEGPPLPFVNPSPTPIPEQAWKPDVKEAQEVAVSIQADD